MTHPGGFDYVEQLRRMTGEVDQATSLSEYRKFHQQHQALLDSLMKTLQETYSPKVPNPLDPRQSPAQAVPVRPPVSPDEKADLVERARFWKVPNPESMQAEELQQRIAAARAQTKGVPLPRGMAYDIIGKSAASLVAEGSIKALGSAVGFVEDLPGAGRLLNNIFNIEGARTWLNRTVSKLDETNEALKLMMPSDLKKTTEYAQAGGRLAGTLLPMYAAWEGLGALGGGAATRWPFLGKAVSSPIARNALKGAITGLMFEDHDDSAGSKAATAGMGAVFGASTVFSKIAAPLFGATIGSSLGAQIGDTPAQKRQNAINFGLGGLALAELGPRLAPAASKLMASFRSPLDEANAQAFHPPGETDVTHEAEITPVLQQSGNDPLKQLPFIGGGGGGGLGAGESAFRALPSISAGEAPYTPGATQHPPAGTGATMPAPVGEIPRSQATLAPGEVRGLLPATTERTPADRALGWALSDVPPEDTERQRMISALNTQTFLDQRFPGPQFKGLASVTNGPEHLLGSKVADTNGNALRVYHGTYAQFGDFDPTKADPDALYGPGLYHTEDPEIATGYAGELGGGKSLPTGEVIPASPNIRPTFLDIKNPFEIEKDWSAEEWNQLIDKMENKFPEFRWDETRESLQRLSTEGKINSNAMYYILNMSSLKPEIRFQGPEYQPGNWLSFPPGERILGKQGLNQILKEIGYDGITHIGGAITGSKPHRVWIAFDPSQIHPPWSAKPLDATQAAGTAHSMSKQATIIESATLPDAIGKDQITDSDVVTAAKSSNPGGVSIVRSIGKPLDVLQDHPDVHFVQYGDRLDALVGPVTDEQIKQYERHGIFAGQQAVSASGIEGTIIGPPDRNGIVTMTREGGPPLRMRRENVFPSRFGTPQVEAPDLYDSFKADLLHNMNIEADKAGMIPVEDIWDPRVPEMMDGHLADYLNRRGIYDQGVRQVIHAQIDRAYASEAKELDPEAQRLQARAVDMATEAHNERETGPEPLPVSLEEKAESKGFIWVSNVGKDGGILKDNLNPESGVEFPMATDAAMEEFLQYMDRAVPDNAPVSQVPIDAAEHIPTYSVLDPHLPHEEYADLLTDAVAAQDEELGNLGGGGGGRQPPPPPAGGGYDDSGAQRALPLETIGTQFDRLRRDDPAKLDQLEARYSTNNLHYMRYHMQRMEDALTEAGVDKARAYDTYEKLETAKIQADNEAVPWTNELADIMKGFRRKALRQGDVTRIHGIADTNDRYRAWQGLKSKGYSDSDISKMIEADNKLSDWFSRIFQYASGSETQPTDWARTMFKYLDTVRQRQATGAADPFDSRGLLPDELKSFADYARTRNMQIRSLNMKALAGSLVKNITFDKFARGPWEAANELWSDSRIPSGLRQFMKGYIRSVRYGYDPSGELMVRGVKAVLSPFGVSDGEAARLLGLGQSAMYMAGMAGRANIFFREALLTVLATNKVDVGIYRGVLTDLGKTENIQAMMERGVKGGWVMQRAPYMEAAGIFQESGESPQRTDLTSAQMARRERVAQIGDFIQEKLPTFIARPTESELNTLKWYDRAIQRYRMVTGESGYRQADVALKEYRQAEMEAAMKRDPSLAMPYETLAQNARFASFSKSINRKLQELIEGGHDEEAKNLYARSVADWTMGRYYRRELPAIVKGGFGRVGFMYGSTPGQYLDGMIDAMSNGRPSDRFRYIAVHAAVGAGLAYAESKTGWPFKRWWWPNMLKYAGSPALDVGTELFQAYKGQVALSNDQRPSRIQQAALDDLKKRGLDIPVEMFNPWSGYNRSVQEYKSSLESDNPFERIMRYTVTGARGDAIDVQRQQREEADSLRNLIQQHDSASTHPGAGALP